MRPRTSVSVEVIEPDGSIERKLLSLADELEDFTEPLTISIGTVQADIRERFKTGTAPSGKKWADWSPRYRKFAENHSKGPIFADRANEYLSGDMYAALNSPTAFRPIDDGLFLDTSELPEYWAYQQFGREGSGGGGKLKGEARKKDILRRATRLTRTMGYDPRRAVLEGKAELERHEAIEGSSNTSNVMPARPFVGLSVEAEAKITVIFERWFNQEIDLAVSSRGRTFGRHSKRGGDLRFPTRFSAR